MESDPSVKRCNVSHVACPACAGWFPVDPALIDQTAVALVCPHCGRHFAAPDAAAAQPP